MTDVRQEYPYERSLYEMGREIRTDTEFTARLITASKLMHRRDPTVSSPLIEVKIRKYSDNTMILSMYATVLGYEMSQTLVRIAFDICTDIALKLQNRRMIMFLVPTGTYSSLMWKWYQTLNIIKPITIALLRGLEIQHFWDVVTLDAISQDEYRRISETPSPPEMRFDGLILLVEMYTSDRAIINIICNSVLIVAETEQVANRFQNPHLHGMKFIDPYIVYPNVRSIGQNRQNPGLTSFAQIDLYPDVHRFIAITLTHIQQQEVDDMVEDFERLGRRRR